jgi:zinc/manganese transport system permease protein
MFSYPFMVNAYEAGTIVAVMAAVAGWYMVLRRQSFAGHTIAVMAFPGASGAALLGVPSALGYYLACGIAALTIGRAGGSRSGGRRGESATIGAVQVSGLALGFLFLSLYDGVLEQLETLLFGTFLGIDRDQVLTLLFVAIVVLGVLAVIARPLLLASLDPELARARGLPVRALDVGFLLVLGLAVAATSQITGALLVFALLVAPPATARVEPSVERRIRADRDLGRSLGLLSLDLSARVLRHIARVRPVRARVARPSPDRPSGSRRP